MAKKGKGKGKTTTYNQTIKGSPTAAASQVRQAELLGQLIKNRRRGARKLRGQYNNAIARNKATRVSKVNDLLSGFKTAVEGVDRSEEDAKGNLGNTTGASLLNRAREGSNAMSELSNMQAGETDRIKGMGASLRNMKVNLDTAANDYSSAMTSINNSLGELNTTATTNINDTLREENTNNASAYGEYQTGQQQAYSDLVDLYGQRGAAFEAAAEASADKNSVTKSRGKKNITTTQTDKVIYGKLGKKRIKQAKNAFKSAAGASGTLANLQGKFYNKPVMTIGQMNAQSAPGNRFIPEEERANQSNLDDLANAGTLRKMAAPEGSKLRKAAI